MKRILHLLIAVVLLAGSAGLTANAAYANIITGTSRNAEQASSTITVPAAADARVLAASPTTNHGAVSRLDVDDPGEHSYLRFNVSGVSGAVTSAVLRLYVTNGSSNGPSIYPTSGGWAENTITWNNKPATTGGAAANLGAISSGVWVEFNLTGVITADGSYDFVLLPDSTDGASFYSREGSSPPQLVVTFNTGPAQTPTETSTPTQTLPPTHTATPTETGAPVDTSTPTQTSTVTNTPAPTNTFTPTTPPTNTATPTITPTATNTVPVTSLSLSAAADARVLSASPTTNYGTVNRLDVDSPGEHSYIRFNVSGVSGAVTSAKLRLYVTNGSSNGPSVYLTSNAWAENTITWNNKPAATSGAVANVGNITSSTWAEFDLTTTITGDGSYDFAILPDSTDGASFYSREGTANFRPQLVINFGTGPAPTPTNTPTAGPSSTPTRTPTPSNTPSGESAVLVGAGDIAVCGSTRDEATALLLDNIPGSVFTAGDNAYSSGSATNFTNCYDPSWGQHKNRTRPAVGDNEYGTAGAAGYFGYFGAAAGAPGKGWYSYNLGNWHIIVLNSECSEVGGCDAGSEQGQWLAADLAANPSTCTLAIFHEPLFSSNGGDSDHVDFWEPLYTAGAEIVISGHRHNYERFAPQTPAGVLDNQRGIRQFIVGTGGSSLSSFGSRVAPNSQVRNASAHGVLKLTLHPTSYDWEFIPVAGQTFSDSGSAQCSP